MKKKIVMLTVVFMLVCGVVSASSINGDYKGDAIVKVIHDGKELQVEDVPAILHDDRTLIPVYLFKQIGVELTWDLEKFSVDVKLPKSETNADVKLTANVAYGYKTVKDFSDSIRSFDRYLGLYAEGYMNNLSNPITDNDLNAEHNANVDNYATLKQTIDKTETVFPQDDYNEMQQILERNLDAITFYYEAVNKVIEWKTYRYSDTNRASDALNVYFDDRGKALKMVFDAIDRSDKKLSDKILSIAHQ